MKIMKKLPLIIDTDIGSDIDDTWALATMFGDPIFDVKLVMTVCEDVQYKCALVDKLAVAAGKRIPVVAGKGSAVQCSAQAAWVGKETEYPTNFEKEFIDAAERGSTIVALGPMTNLAQLAKRYPDLFPHLNIVAMLGAIRKGYINQSEPAAECNAALDPEAFRNVLASGAKITLVPLDVCRDYIVDGADFQKIRQSAAPLARAVIENYEIWHRDYVGGAIKYPVETSSGILYDLLPVYYLRFPERFEGEKLKISVTDEGRTVESREGREAFCLLNYEGREVFDEYLITILSGGIYGESSLEKKAGQ